MRALLRVDFSQAIYFTVSHVFCFLCVWKHQVLYERSNIPDMIIKSVFCIQVHAVKFRYCAFPLNLGKPLLPTTSSSKPWPCKLKHPGKLDFWQQWLLITQVPNRKIRRRESLRDNQWCRVWLSGKKLHCPISGFGNPRRGKWQLRVRIVLKASVIMFRPFLMLHGKITSNSRLVNDNLVDLL